MNSRQKGTTRQQSAYADCKTTDCKIKSKNLCVPEEGRPAERPSAANSFAGLIAAPVPEAVEQDGSDDDATGDNFLSPVRHFHLGAAVGDNRHNHRANFRAENRALSAR